MPNGHRWAIVAMKAIWATGYKDYNIDDLVTYTIAQDWIDQCVQGLKVTNSYFAKT